MGSVGIDIVKKGNYLRTLNNGNTRKRLLMRRVLSVYYFTLGRGKRQMSEASISRGVEVGRDTPQASETGLTEFDLGYFHWRVVSGFTKTENA